MTRVFHGDQVRAVVELQKQRAVPCASDALHVGCILTKDGCANCEACKRYGTCGLDASAAPRCVATPEG